MPFPPLADAVNDLITTIANTANTLTGNASAMAEEAYEAFAGTLDSTKDEWEDFIDGLTDAQTEVMARLIDYLARLQGLGASMDGLRAELAAGTVPQGTSVPQTIRSGVEMIEAGALILADLRDVFGPDGIDEAIWTASPLLARKMQLPAT